MSVFTLFKMILYQGVWSQLNRQHPLVSQYVVFLCLIMFFSFIWMFTFVHFIFSLFWCCWMHINDGIWQMHSLRPRFFWECFLDECKNSVLFWNLDLKVVDTTNRKQTCSFWFFRLLSDAKDVAAVSNTRLPWVDPGFENWEERRGEVKWWRSEDGAAMGRVEGMSFCC